MKVLLTAINAKFIHSSLAVRSLYAYNKDLARIVETVEYTINNDRDFILSDIFSKNPDVVCFFLLYMEY